MPRLRMSRDGHTRVRYQVTSPLGSMHPPLLQVSEILGAYPPTCSFLSLDLPLKFVCVVLDDFWAVCPMLPTNVSM